MIMYDETKHEYKLDDRVLPSVTQMLSAVFPKMFDFSAVDAQTLAGAQEYGTMIHKRIENSMNGYQVSECPELTNFWNIWKEQAFDDARNEVLLYNDDFAGRADIIAQRDGDIYIIDIKTTSQKNKTKVQYQLSLYQYLYQKMYGNQVVGLAEIWLHNNDWAFEEITYKGDDWCDKVINAYYDGMTLPDSEELTILDSFAVATVEKMFEVYEEAKNYLDTFREHLMKTMIETGNNKVTFGSFTASLRAESVSKRFDSTKFKKEHPDLAKEYEKEVKTSASVVLTRKGDNND